MRFIARKFNNQFINFAITICPAAIKIARWLFSGHERQRKTQSHSIGDGTNIGHKFDAAADKYKTC